MNKLFSELRSSFPVLTSIVDGYYTEPRAKEPLRVLAYNYPSKCILYARTENGLKKILSV